MKRKSDVLTVMFFALAIVLFASVIPSVLNYMEFYRAIAKFNFMVTGVKLDKSSLERLEVMITFNFTVSNPTGFSGLVVESISSKLYYENGVHSVPSSPYRLLVPKLVHAKYLETTWWELKNYQSPTSRRLEPYQNVTIPITFRITPHTQHLATCGTYARFAALNFIMFLDNHRDDINWRLQGVAYLSSFLGCHALPFDLYAQSIQE